MTTIDKKQSLTLLLAFIAFNVMSLSVWASTSNSPIKITVKGEGKPMILLPGLNSDISVWEETVAHYQNEYECHLVQLAGFAGADPIDFDSVFLGKVKEALVGYIKDKNLVKPVFIGHSLGGFMTMMIGVEHPDLIGRMVIVDAAPFFSGLMFPGATVESAKTMAAQMRSQMASQSREQFEATLPQYLAPLVNGEEKLKVLVDWGLKSDPKTSGQAMYELYTTDLREALSKINSPALVLVAWIGYKNYGATRENTLAKFKEQYAKMPNHQIKITDEGKHFIMWDDPAFFFSSIDKFLNANP